MSNFHELRSSRPVHFDIWQSYSLLFAASESSGAKRGSQSSFFSVTNVYC